MSGGRFNNELALANVGFLATEVDAADVEAELRCNALALVNDALGTTTTSSKRIASSAVLPYDVGGALLLLELLLP